MTRPRIGSRWKTEAEIRAEIENERAEAQEHARRDERWRALVPRVSYCTVCHREIDCGTWCGRCLDEEERAYE